LCGIPQSTLQYRYGTPAHTELAFPDKPSDGINLLRYAHYFRSQTQRTEVTFSHAGTDYAVFDYLDHGKRSAGVHVTLTDGAEHDVPCAGPIQGHLSTLQKILRCDADNVLNDGNCPWRQLPDPTLRILAVCEFGRVSSLAAATLRQIGFQRAIALDGGTKAWRDAGYPIVSTWEVVAHPAAETQSQVGSEPVLAAGKFQPEKLAMLQRIARNGATWIATHTGLPKPQSEPGQTEAAAAATDRHADV
jgi:rhodanese-related sulfurtransferase